MSEYTDGFEDGFNAAIDLLRGFPKERVMEDFSGESRIRNTARFAEASRGLSTDGFTRSGGRTGRAKPKKRKKSAWNVFVAQEMPKVLKKHPRFTPQRAMKEVSRRWRNSPKNPNRRKRR